MCLLFYETFHMVKRFICLSSLTLSYFALALFILPCPQTFSMEGEDDDDEFGPAVGAPSVEHDESEYDEEEEEEEEEEEGEEEEGEAGTSGAGPSNAQEQEQEEEPQDEDSKNLMQGKPPRDVDKWRSDRYHQAEQMIDECFDDRVAGYRDIKDLALDILRHMYKLCYTEMGDMPEFHAKNGGTYANGEPFIYDPDAPDIFRDHYKTLGSASIWACFALQQALFEHSHNRFEIGCPDAVQEWQLTRLHEILLESKGEKFQSREAASADSACSMVGGNVKSLKGIARSVNKEASGEKTRHLNVHSLGPREKQLLKAKTFAYVFRRTFDSSVRPFCGDIINLMPPRCSAYAYAPSNSQRQAVSDRKAGEWGKKVSSKLTNGKALAPHPFLKPPPEKQKGVTRIISTAEKMAAAKHAAELKDEQERHWKQEANDAQLSINVDKDIRMMYCLDVENERVADVIAAAAHSIRMRRETIQRTSIEVSKAACANVVKQATFEICKQKGSLEYNRLLAERDRQLDVIRRVNFTCKYGIDCDDDKETGAWIPGAFDALPQADKDVYNAGYPAEIQVTDIPGYCIPPPKLTPSVKVPFAPGCKKTNRIDAKVKAPGMPEDYATLFGFDTLRDAQQEISSIRRKIQQDDEHSEVSPWQVWMLHMMIGSSRDIPPRMNTDLVKYTENLRLEMQRRKNPFPNLKGIKDGVVFDRDAYDASLLNRQRLVEERQEIEQRKAQRKKAQEDKKVAKEEEKRQKREDREDRKMENELGDAMKKAQNEAHRAQKRIARHAQIDIEKKSKADAALQRYEEKIRKAASKQRRESSAPLLIKKPRLNENGHLVRKGTTPIVFTQVLIPDYKPFNFSTQNKKPTSFFIKVAGYSHRMDPNEMKKRSIDEMNLCCAKDEGADRAVADLEGPIGYKQIITRIGIVRVANNWPVFQAGTPEEKRARARFEALGMLAKQ